MRFVTLSTDALYMKLIVARVNIQFISDTYQYRKNFELEYFLQRCTC